MQLHESSALANSSVSVSQALALFDSRMLYDRPMYLKMDTEAASNKAAQLKLLEIKRSIACRAENTNGFFYNRLFVENVS